MQSAWLKYINSGPRKQMRENTHLLVFRALKGIREQGITTEHFFREAVLRR